MTELISKMLDYCEQVAKQNVEMYNTLIEVVNKAGGIIDTSNEDKQNDFVYAIVYNESMEHYMDYRVDSVRSVNGYLEVHLSDYDSDEEEDSWFSIMGGMVLINATLYDLCEVLPEYIEEKL